MTTRLISASGRPNARGLTVIHTAVNPGVLISAIAATTNGDARQTSLAVRRAGNVRWLSQLIPTNAGAASSLTPEKVMLEAGDELVATSTNTFWQRINPVGLLGSAQIMLSNPDASVQIIVTSDGIYTSTDKQKTWVKTYFDLMDGTVCGGWINGAFRIFLSATSSLVSTTGDIWTVTACVNAPVTVKAAVTGGLVSDASTGTHYGLKDGYTQVVKTTDGVAWTNHAPALPVNCASLCFTGTHLIAGNYAANSKVYRSAAGGAWAEVTATASATQSVNSLTSNGAGRVLASFQGGSIPATTSADHGATFTASGASGNYSNASSLLWTGRHFVMHYSVNACISATGAPYSFEILSSAFAPQLVAGGKLWGVNAVAELGLPLNGGLDVTASIMEVLG